MKLQQLMKPLTIGLAVLWTIFSTPSMAEEKQWTAEQQNIININTWVPLALKEAGFDEYSKLFHPDYSNWVMSTDPIRVLNREQFLSGVKSWFEKGNFAHFSYVEPISVDVMGDIAYVRHLQEEHFTHHDGTQSKFMGHFASIMKKHQGRWTFYRTSFDTRYRGPIEGTDKTFVKE